MKVTSKTTLGRLGDLDLRLLRVFQGVVDCGGMAAAELELNVGISTISRHIKDLELRLGLVLCRRGRAGFALTPDGERVYAETQRLLAATDEFRDSIDDIHRRMGGDMQVGIFDKTATNPMARIGQAIAAFTELAPQVKLSLHVAPINTIERQVMAGEFHVGIIPAHRSSEALDYAPLFSETMRLYCGQEHPLFEHPAVSAEQAQAPKLAWDDLRAHRFAGLGYHSPNIPALSHLKDLLDGFTEPQ